MSETEIYPKAEFIRKPNLSEYRMYRIPNVPKSECSEFRIFRIPNNPKSECSEVPKCGLNTRHDNREVTLTHFYSFDPSANFSL